MSAPAKPVKLYAPVVEFPTSIEPPELATVRLVVPELDVLPVATKAEFQDSKTITLRRASPSFTAVIASLIPSRG